MAPPLTLTLSMSGWCSFSHASTTDANASLTSNRSMSSTFRPARCRTFSVAGMGPVSMVTGSTPARAKVWNRARGVRPSWLAFSSVMISMADALGLKAGLAVAADLRVPLHDLGPEGHAARDDRGTHRRGRHDLDPGRDDDVIGTGDHALGREVGRLLGRPALAVDRCGRHRL